MRPPLPRLVVPVLVGLCVTAIVRAEQPARESLDEITKRLEAKGAHEPFQPKTPLGLDPEAIAKGIPQDNPLTPAKVELGKQLYFDGRLSADGTVSCASCHDPAHGWADPGQFSKGVAGKLGGRNAPTVINRVLGKVQFWDGRAGTLEQQALGPIENPVEMAAKLDDVVTKLNGLPGYKAQFERVFGGPATKERIALAIAAFERTVLSGASRVDLDDEAERFAKVDESDEFDAETRARAKAAREAVARAPLTESEKRGKKLFFNKASCALCHSGQNYTDELFYNLGVGAQAKTPDEGLCVISKKAEDWGKFKTPGLRNIAESAPYMHDGSEATLEAVVDYYDRGGTKNKNLSDRIKPLGLTKEEKADLVAFMKALSGEVTKVGAVKLP